MLFTQIVLTGMRQQQRWIEDKVCDVIVITHASYCVLHAYDVVMVASTCHGVPERSQCMVSLLLHPSWQHTSGSCR